MKCEAIFRSQWKTGGALSLLILTALPAIAQLDDSCVVSALNRSAPVQADGTWVLPNVPANVGQVRVRANCVENGVVRSGQSDYFQVPADGVIEVAEIVFDQTEPIADRLEVSAPRNELTQIGEEVQLTVTARYADGSAADVTSSQSGTSYTVSNSRVATIDADGRVTAVASGSVLITAVNEGAMGLLRLQAVVSGDTDGDGLPDDFELAGGLDPNNPFDALDDQDGDRLTTLEEFLNGLDPFLADTDGDGLIDGAEQEDFGTDPRVADTDGDLVSDGLEAMTASDPLDPSSVDLGPILESFGVEPSSFTLVFNTVVGEASRRLRVTATLIDGTVLDATGPPYGVAYASNDLTIASFGIEAGRIFASQDGTTTVTASIGTFSDTVEVTVRSFSPTALSFLRIPGFANDVAVQGDYAYVAAGARGLYVVRVVTPVAPSIVGSVNTPGNANGVVVDGDYAYVADGSEDLRIVDIRDPANPVIVGAVEADGRAVDVAVADGRAYLASGSRGLHVIDVSDPEAPLLLGSVDTGDARGVDVSGDRVVVADGTSGVQVVDVSDPLNPLLVGSTHTRAGATSAAAGVAVREDRAWVADGADVRLGGLRALDFSEPSAPAVVGSTSNNFGLTGVALERDFALTSDYLFANAVPIFNVAFATPVFVAALDFSGAPSFRWDVGTGIAVQNGLVFLTGASGPGAFDNAGKLGDTGLHIGRYLDPESISNVPPEVALVDPADGATVLERRLLTVRADAIDDVRVGVVEFLINGETVRLDFRPPFEHTFRAPSGPATLTLGALARDLASNQGAAEEIVLEVVPDNAPTADFLSPSEGTAVTEGTTIPITVLATDDAEVASVTLSVDGMADQVLATAPYVFQVSVPLDQSTFFLSAAATDDAGQTASTDLLTLAILEDQPPFVSIVEPVDGAPAVAGGILRVVAGAIDDLGVERVRLRLAGDVVGEDLDPPFEFEVSVPVAGTELVLIAEAVDTLGQVSLSEQLLLDIEPDPMTTVFGRVTSAGLPVGGAMVETTSAQVAISDSDGFFQISDVPTVPGAVVAFASAEIDGTAFAGESAPAVPVAGGITDVGDISLTEAPLEDCPCLDPTNWSSELGQLWEIFVTTDFSDFVDDVTCIDNAEGTELSLASPAVGLAFGIRVDLSPAACQSFAFGTTNEEEQASLPIAPSLIESCRQVPLGIAQGLGVDCSP